MVLCVEERDSLIIFCIPKEIRATTGNCPPKSLKELILNRTHLSCKKKKIYWGQNGHLLQFSCIIDLLSFNFLLPCLAAKFHSRRELILSREEVPVRFDWKKTFRIPFSRSLVRSHWATIKFPNVSEKKIVCPHCLRKTSSHLLSSSTGKQEKVNMRIKIIRNNPSQVWSLTPDWFISRIRGKENTWNLLWKDLRIVLFHLRMQAKDLNKIYNNL